MTKSNQSATECRNCGALNVLIFCHGFIAPFFMKRVHGIHLMSLGEKMAIKVEKLSDSFINVAVKKCFRVFGNTRIGKKLNNFRLLLKTNIRVCKECGFVGPDYNYTDSELLQLYSDYRSDSYNSERTLFEPKYINIQSSVGKDEIEINNRLNNVDDLMKKYVELEAIRSVLDWGGGEGKFVPRELRNKKVFVLDVSNEMLVDPSFVRIEQPSDDDKFDFIQLCHVLEHVGSPRELLKNILPYLNSSGYLYIEVPQDRSEEDIQQFIKENPDVRHTIHEHLNLFTTQSIKALANSLGLKEIIVVKNTIDVGWCQVTIISGLFKKNVTLLV